MKNTRQLLQELTSRLPPPEGCNHVISLDGDRLVAHVWLDGVMRPFRFDEADLDKSVQTMLGEIEELVRMDRAQ